MRVCLALSVVYSSLVCGGGVGCGGDDDAGDGGSSASGNELDACEIVTQEDATALFGKPAVRDSGTLVVDPQLLGECLWTYQEEDEIGSVSSQLLQFHIWGSANYHSVPSDADPFEVGQDGYVRFGEVSGVDIGWLQGGKALSLSYFSIGDNMPTHAEKLEPMKTLALELSDRL